MALGLRQFVKIVITEIITIHTQNSILNGIIDRKMNHPKILFKQNITPVYRSNGKKLDIKHPNQTSESKKGNKRN